MTDTATPLFDQWAIVELLGHRRLAGRLREVQIAGHGFLRLDIPAAGDDPARTQYVAPGSVYAIHPCDEAMAQAAAEQWRATPIQRWELQALLPAAPASDDPWGRDLPDDEDEDEDASDQPRGLISYL